MTRRRRNPTPDFESPSQERARRERILARAEQKRAERDSRRTPKKPRKTTATQKRPAKRPQRDQPSGYRLRARSLATLGFSSYREYLQSNLWDRIRSRVLRRDRFQCKSCLAPATQVHHRHYAFDVMAGRNIGPLISLCRDCHKQIEFHNGQKSKLGTANKILADNIRSTRSASRIAIARHAIATNLPQPSASGLSAEFIQHWNEQAQPHSGQGCPITPQRVGESTPGNETPSRGSVITAPGPRRSTTTERLEPAQSRDLEGQ